MMQTISTGSTDTEPEYWLKLQEAAEAWNEKQKYRSPCPSCGHCPHCGRGGYHTRPWYEPYPSYPVYPTITYTYPINDIKF